VATGVLFNSSIVNYIFGDFVITIGGFLQLPFIPYLCKHNYK
jgi:hypothetical protein